MRVYVEQSPQNLDECADEENQQYSLTNLDECADEENLRNVIANIITEPQTPKNTQESHTVCFT